GVGVAGAAAAAGLVADRVHRRRADALETGASLFETPSRTLTVTATDGVALHVEVDEPAEHHDGGSQTDENGLERPTVVLSHGYCLTSECWVFQRRYLRWAGYRVVVWDQRGHGRSGRGDPAASTIGQLGEDLAAVIAAVAPDGPLALVGHSMGGMTTMALGTLHPDLVRDRVVALGCISTSAGGMPLASGDFAATAGRLLLERLGPRVAGLFETRPEVLRSILSANSELAEFLVERYSFASPVPRSVVRLTAKMLLGTNLTVMSSFTPAFIDYDQTGGLAAYSGCETLVFNGEQDILTPPEHSEEIVRALPGAQHVIVRDAGHVIMLEHPDLLNQQLDALVGRASTREAENIPAETVPRVRRVVTDVDKKRRIERGMQRKERTPAARARRSKAS
ncbi:MAG: alpha/beta hydrolase, partial [Lapillicoccus sp.]